MSEGPSDPDLALFHDLPDTATVAAVRDGGTTARIVEALKGFGRWATRHHIEQKKAAEAASDERNELRGLALKVIGAVIVGALGMMGTVIGAAIYVGIRLERYENNNGRIGRLERAVFMVDEVTTATTEGDHL